MTARTVAQVAAELNCSEWFVRDSVRKGLVTPARLGKHKHAPMRFTDAHLAQLVDALTPVPAATTRKRRRRRT